MRFQMASREAKQKVSAQSSQLGVLKRMVLLMCFCAHSMKLLGLSLWMLLKRRSGANLFFYARTKGVMHA